MKSAKAHNSTLYGSDAEAGVINIITVKKGCRSFNGNAAVSAGNYGTLTGNMQLYGKINKLTYTARFAQLHTSGFSSATDTAKGANNRNYDSDGYDGRTANAQLDYQVTNALSLKAFVLWSRYSAGVDAGVFTDDNDYTIHNKSLITGTGFVYKKTVSALPEITGIMKVKDII